MDKFQFTFNNATKSLKVKNIAIIHLDGDLHQSYKATSENLCPIITKAGIMVIDDYNIKKSTVHARNYQQLN